MDYSFDQEHLQEIGRTYATVVTVTDLVRGNEVYQGPLNDTCFEMIAFYLDNGWLEGMSWTKRERPMENGWTELVTDAVTKSGEVVFTITVLIKGKLEEPKPQENKKVPWFLIGLLSAFVPVGTLLEGVGIAAVFNFFKKKEK